MKIELKSDITNITFNYHALVLLALNEGIVNCDDNKIIRLKVTNFDGIMNESDWRIQFTGTATTIPVTVEYHVKKHVPADTAAITKLIFETQSVEMGTATTTNLSLSHPVYACFFPYNVTEVKLKLDNTATLIFSDEHDDLIHITLSSSPAIHITILMFDKDRFDPEMFLNGVCVATEQKKKKVVKCSGAINFSRVNFASISFTSAAAAAAAAASDDLVETTPAPSTLVFVHSNFYISQNNISGKAFAS